MTQEVHIFSITTENTTHYNRDTFKAFVEVALPLESRLNLAVLFTAPGDVSHDIRNNVQNALPVLRRQLASKLNGDKHLRRYCAIESLPRIEEDDLKIYRVVNCFDGVLAT